MVGYVYTIFIYYSRTLNTTRGSTITGYTNGQKELKGPDCFRTKNPFHTKITNHRHVRHESIPRIEVCPFLPLAYMQCKILTDRYMSGPKADAILARSTDPTIKKRKKKLKNEDYTVKLENGEGLRMKDEDEWKGAEDVDMEGEDAPGESEFLAS
jgi:hypothetical protein